MNTSLRGKYCIAGVGETEFSRGSNRTTRAMGTEASGQRKRLAPSGDLSSVAGAFPQLTEMQGSSVFMSRR